MNNPLASFLEDVEPANTPEFKWPENCPPPGIYENIPDAEYRSWNAISQSTLKVASEATWAHVRATLDGKIERKSDALAFGRALHTWLLEPHLFEDTYQVALPCAAEIKSGDRKGEECGCAGRYFNSLDEVWLCGKHAPKGFDQGVHLGGEWQEGTYHLVPVDVHDNETIHVPCIILETHPSIERV